MGCAPRACRVSLNPSTRPSPTVWAWGSRSAARLSKPMVGGSGRPGASRGVRSFSLQSPLNEPPSVIDVAYWHFSEEGRSRLAAALGSKADSDKPSISRVHALASSCPALDRRARRPAVAYAPDSDFYLI